MKQTRKINELSSPATGLSTAVNAATAGLPEEGAAVLKKAIAPNRSKVKLRRKCSRNVFILLKLELLIRMHSLRIQIRTQQCQINAYSDQDPEAQKVKTKYK